MNKFKPIVEELEKRDCPSFVGGSPDFPDAPIYNPGDVDSNGWRHLVAPESAAYFHQTAQSVDTIGGVSTPHGWVVEVFKRIDGPGLVLMVSQWGPTLPDGTQDLTLGVPVNITHKEVESQPGDPNDLLVHTDYPQDPAHPPGWADITKLNIWWKNKDGTRSGPILENDVGVPESWSEFTFDSADPTHEPPPEPLSAQKHKKHPPKKHHKAQEVSHVARDAYFSKGFDYASWNQGGSNL